MCQYDRESKKAEEFINHEEILETLRYAEENKHNEALIAQILEKAKKRKGLEHREAMVLLDCDIEEKNQEIYALAEQIKKDYPQYPAFDTYDELLKAIKEALQERRFV